MNVKHLITWWAVNTVALLIAVLLIGSVTVSGLGAIVLAGFVMGLLNAFVKPVLRILGAPLALVTLGLSSLLINVAIVAVTGLIVDGLKLGSFVSILEATLVVWIANLVLQMMPTRS